jgi:hypothetical protein
MQFRGAAEVQKLCTSPTVQKRRKLMNFSIDVNTKNYVKFIDK